MRVCLEGQEIKNCQFTHEGVNLLGFDSIDEVYFDVFEIKTKNYQIIKEKKDEKNGLPLVELDVTIENILYKNILFHLTKENVVKINKNSFNRKNSVILEKSKPVIQQNKKVVKENLIITDPKKQESKESDPVTQELKKLIQKESKSGLISKLIKENAEELFRQLLLNDGKDKQIQKFFESYTSNYKKSFIEIAEKIARREGLRVMEGGGGTNSVQYANGGTMNGELTINDDLHVSGNIYSSNIINKKWFVIGDGMNDTYTLTHNFNSLNTIVQVYDVSTNEVVHPFIQNLDLNNTIVNFGSVIGINSYRVVIIS